jgi:phosphate transport system substrate-binding protein
MRLLAEAFRPIDPKTEIEVMASLGTNGGLRAVQSKVIEIAVLARPLTEAERASGLNDHEYARTPLTFATHPETAIRGISLADVARVYSGELAVWPDGLPVRLIRRPSTEADWTTLGGLSIDMARAVQLAMRRPGLLTAATDQDNAETLERLRGSFGLIALGQLLAERRRLTSLSLDGLESSTAALLDRTWPMVRSLHIVTAEGAASNVAAFVKFVSSADGAAAVLADCGYLPVGRSI